MISRNLCLIVVNRSSSLSWISSQWFCLILIHVKTCSYISPHIYFYVKRLFKHLFLKRERAEKALLQKLVWLWKCGTKCIQNIWCQTQRLFPQRNIKNFTASLLKNWVVLIKKYEKRNPNEKFSINVNTLVRSHICSFLLVR